MHGKFNRDKAGISSSIFGVVAIVLLILAVVGFSLYITKSPSTTTVVSTVVTTVSATSTGSSMSNGSSVIAFSPVKGQMVTSAWLVVTPLGMMNEWAMVVHAQGLETTNSTSTYLVEAAQMSGAMRMVPITNATATSDFQTNVNGTGTLWVTLNVDPFTSFESVDIIFLPSMNNMNSMEVVANATLTMMHG